MKATASQFLNATRTIKVPLVFEDGEGNRQTEDFKVIYRSMSPRIAREMQALEGEQTEGRSVTKSLAHMLISIPEITNGDGAALAITEENLEQIAKENLTALYEAITNDIAGPTQPKIPPPGSEA